MKTRKQMLSSMTRRTDRTRMRTATTQRISPEITLPQIIPPLPILPSLATRQVF